MTLEEAIEEIEHCIDNGLMIDWVPTRVILEYAKRQRDKQLKEKK